jgi:hypothetical protein
MRRAIIPVERAIEQRYPWAPRGWRGLGRATIFVEHPPHMAARLIVTTPDYRIVWGSTQERRRP